MYVKALLSKASESNKSKKIAVSEKVLIAYSGTAEKERERLLLYAGNYRRSDAETNDYYATDPMAVELLLQQEKFTHNVWEPAVGGG